MLKKEPAAPSVIAPDADPAAKAGPDAASIARRKLLGNVALGAGAGAAVLAGWPLAAALVSRPKQPLSEALPFLDVAGESEITKQPIRVLLIAPMRDGWLTMLRDLGAAWLYRTPGEPGGPGVIEALSAICPHLGCGIERYGTGYFCPCHESKFDAQGERKSGPSPRGLDRLAVRIEKGRVLVQPRPPADSTR